MKHLMFVAALLVACPSAFAASDFLTGLQAYRSGSYAAALTALTASAERGDPRAAQLLADMYAGGRGVAPNPGIAFQWRQRAALLGDPGAQFAVGMQYLNGDGVPRAPQEAALWLEKAALRNHPNAQFELGLLYLDGDGVAQDSARGVAWIREAADQGLFDAQQALAEVYRKGAQGLPQNAAAAAHWASLAQQNQQAGQQINQLIVQQQNAIAIARSTVSAPVPYPWVYPAWGFGWNRYGGWNYGVGVGGIWW